MIVIAVRLLLKIMIKETPSRYYTHCYRELETQVSERLYLNSSAYLKQTKEKI
jgi:hypothetical protein